MIALSGSVGIPSGKLFQVLLRQIRIHSCLGISVESKSLKINLELFWPGFYFSFNYILILQARPGSKEIQMTLSLWQISLQKFENGDVLLWQNV